MDLYSLPDTFSGTCAQDRVPDVFAVEVNSMPVREWTLGIAFPGFDANTPQSRELFVARLRVTVKPMTD